MNRREAAPLEFEYLSDSQKQAAENIAWSLQSALEDLDAVSESPADADNHIDRWRASQIFFVSGEPGSGKTTVYLTLQNLLQEPGMAVHEQFQGLRELRVSHSRLRWLEPLDLEPVAQSTNFLAAVLVRLENAMDESKAPEFSRDRRPGLLENRDVQQDLRRLENDVVLAWDGTVPERAEHVDPEVFSQDVLRAEKARLQVKQRLRKALGPRARAEGDKPTLYVLPVDDFYLHPASSLEFLRLLRMISVPELFILVMGDLDVVHQLFRLDQLGQLVRLVGERSAQALLPSQEQLPARAEALTSHALGKLIPPSQQAFLEVMDKLQALEYRPQRPGRKQKEKSLADLLGEVSLELDKSSCPDSALGKLDPDNLYHFLLLREPSEEIKGDSYTYSGLAVLDLPPREVVDLWLSLAGLVRQKEREETETKLQDSLLRRVVDRALVAIDYDTYLDLEGKERCREAIQGTPYDRRIFHTEVLSIRDERVGRREIPLKGDRRVALWLHLSWVFRPDMAAPKTDVLLKKEGTRDGSIDYLSPRPTAWLTVLHDLMALSSARLRGDPLTPSPFELEWVVVSTDSKPGRRWPTPNWPTFRQFDLLAFRWKKVLNATEMGSPDLDDVFTWLAYNWLDAITEILSGEWVHDREIQGLEISDEQWRELSEKTDSLVTLVSQPGLIGGHRSVVRGWLLRLEIFLSEEFAIPRRVLDLDEFPSDRLKGFWKKEQKRIESIRQSEVDQPMAGESEEPATA